MRRTGKNFQLLSVAINIGVDWAEEGAVFCPKCGNENNEGAFCARCGAKLPRFIQEEQVVEQHTPINSRLNVIENAVERVLSGEWPLEEFLPFLEEIHEVLSSKEQEIREIAIPEESIGEFQEELSVGFSGIALYNEGIAHMLSFDGENPEVLSEGLKLVRKGNERINEAMRINRASRSKLEEEIAREATATL